MKTLILALALASISTQAAAESSYTEQIKIKYACETLGGVSKAGFQKKVDGVSLEVIRTNVIEEVSAANRTEMYQLVKMGYEADSEEEAYMLGWGHCMDEYS